MAGKNNFTKSFISSLPPAPQGKRNYYHDSKVVGLEIMVTDKGSKSFKVIEFDFFYMFHIFFS